MKRRFFNAFTLLSTLACMTIIAFWVRSYFVADVMAASMTETSKPPLSCKTVWELSSLRGNFNFTRTRNAVVYRFPWYRSLDLRSFQIDRRPPKWEKRTYSVIGWRQHRLAEEPRWAPEPHTGLQQVMSSGGKIYATVRDGAQVKCGFVALPFAILPTWWLAMGFRRHVRKRQGHCYQCNYDLRASSERCPECGTPVVRPITAGPSPELL